MKLSKLSKKSIDETCGMAAILVEIRKSKK